MIDTLFICKDRNQGYADGKYGLWNSASFVISELRKYGVDAKLISVTDSNGIDREIHKYKPKNVVLEALWVPPYKIKELTRLHKDVTFICRIHSKATFLANEGIAFEWINAYSEESVVLSCNHEEFNTDLRRLGYYSLYLPNIYDFKESFRKSKEESSILDIGCFGSLRPMKNHLNQAISAIQFAESINLPLRFHINGTRSEQNGQNVLKNLRALFTGRPYAVLVEYGWLPHQDFLKLMSSMDISMQVSLSESFNIVTADAISQNVPVVTSNEISFSCWPFKSEPTETRSIVNALYNAYNYGRVGAFFNKMKLKKYNKKAVKEWFRWRWN